MPKVNGLSGKQQAFVTEYLVDLNATQAAIRAGYSAKTAEVIAHENLRKPQIAAAIQQAMDQRARRTEITADLVLERINRIAEVAENSAEFANALKANELLGKHLKLFTDKQEVKHEGDIILRISHEDANL